MYIFEVMVSFAGGIGIGCLAMKIVHIRRGNKLEQYQIELDYYRMELEREKYHLDHDWECPVIQPDDTGNENPSYRRIIINK